MITVHHLNNSRSQRVLWLLEELELDYEIIKYERDPETMRAPAQLRQVHPLGKAPILTDGDETIAESGAIIEYLAETHGPQLRPQAGSPEARRYTYWLHFAEGSLMPPLVLKLVSGRIEAAPLPFFLKPVSKGIAAKLNSGFIGPELKSLYTFIESELSQRDWFAGDSFSAADIQMSFPLEAAFARGGLDDAYPSIASFLARIHARPAYKRALERGGTYEILGG
jgi:glutathione S-transferase